MFKADRVDTDSCGECSDIRDNEFWQLSLETFTSKIHGQGNPGDRHLPRKIRDFYQRQDELIESYVALLDETDSAYTENRQKADEIKQKALIYSRITLFANLILLVEKIVATFLSGSLSVFSSVIDSIVDLSSGILMWFCNRAIIKRDRYMYPQGRTRLEPLTIVLLCTIMSFASGLVVIQSIQKINKLLQTIPLEDFHRISVNGTEFICISDVPSYALSQETAGGLVFETDSIFICSTTVGLKVILYLICRGLPNPSVKALAQDHRNDIIFNSFALACGLIGYRLFAYVDPVGALIISMYIIISWIQTGWNQGKMLIGQTASPDFLKKLTWIAINHHPKICSIDTVRAFHLGNNFLVEVDIILPENMNLFESHNIGESLQQRLEKLDEVERAFVHVDYEGTHHPEVEHKST